MGRSDQLLEAAPAPLRRWECCRYLKRLDHPELFTLPGNGQFTTGLSFSGDGRRMAAMSNSGDAGVQVWDLATRKPLASINLVATRLGRTFTACAMAPDGSTFALGDQAGKITLFDAVTGEAVRDVGTLEGGVDSLAISPDGALLAAARVDFRNGSPLIPALAAKRKMGLQVWRLGDGAVVFSPTDVGASVAFSPDGRHLLAFKRNTAVRVLPNMPETFGTLWKTADWTELRTLGQFGSWSFDGKGRTIALAGRVPETQTPFLKVEEVESGKEIASFRPEYPPGDIALGPDGSTLAVCRALLIGVRPLGRQDREASCGPSGGAYRLAECRGVRARRQDPRHLLL